MGALAPLYLNLVTLAPGQALFLPSGELHAYLEGTALEIMANSDNVLRGGLTPKHVDVQELLATLVFDAHVRRAAPGSSDSGPGEKMLPDAGARVRARLPRGRPRPAVHRDRRPRCRDPAAARGCLPAPSDGSELALARGRSVLVPAALESYVLEGEGRIARARVRRRHATCPAAS